MAANHLRASAIGMALNNKSASVEIPKYGGLNLGRDNFTAVSTNPSSRSAMLPTPPNSISPNLPPQRQDARAAQESDFDLQDAPSNALTAEALDSLGDLDSAGAITPAMLAKHHLPDILLNHGPLAIRHVMSYLNSNVPGFSRITSAKARRLVVAALEGRGAGLDAIGDEGDVIFEKVGWGRWDARRRGHATRDGTPPASYTSSNSGMQSLVTREGLSGASASGRYSSEEDHDMLENEADKMSLDDDDGGYASSEAPPADPMMDDFDENDVTDEEDWGSIGAEALRARSLRPGSLPQSQAASGGRRLYQPIYPSRPQNTSKHMAQSAPVKAIPFAKPSTNFNTINDSQERAAVEALLSLGTM